MKRLLTWVAPQARWLAPAAALGILTVGAGLGLMGTGAYLISRAALHPPTVLLLLVPIVGVRFFSLLRASARYGERYVSHDVTFRLLSDLKTKSFSALVRKLPSQLFSTASGDWLRRLSGDVDRLQNFYLDAVGPPVTWLFITAATTALLLPMGRAMAAVAAGGLAAAGLTIPLAATVASRRGTLRRVDIEASLAAHLVASLEGMADLLMTPLGGAERQRLHAESRLAAGRQGALDRLAAASQGALTLISGLTALGVLWAAIPEVRAQHLSGIEVGVAVLVTMAAFEAAAPLVRSFSAWSEDLAASRRVLPDQARPAPPAARPEDAGLTLTHLSFRYSDRSPWILEDVSLSLPEGTRAAIIGPSGAGKSSLLYLLAGLMPAPRGSVRLGSVDLGSVDEAQLASMISMVDQRPHLFNDTLARNLKLGRPGATEADLAKALDLACLTPLIARLPKGLETPVGEGGRVLSGGERQRVALARALLRDPRVLLLDEPLSGLDRETARRVMANLDGWSRGRTVLFVTHRTVPEWASSVIWRLDAGCLRRLAPSERALFKAL